MMNKLEDLFSFKCFMAFRFHLNTFHLETVLDKWQQGVGKAHESYWLSPEIVGESEAITVNNWWEEHAAIRLLHRMVDLLGLRWTVGLPVD